ncbi:MAG TPA: hypothetical protein PKG48_03000 [Bacteroidales bacterium]|mgnify:CR=1 FL=1|nr:hypothetical protein [Bacteroidales bacterium]
MNKLTITLFLFLFWVLSGVAQHLELTGVYGPLPNGSTLTLKGPPDTLQMITWLHLTNRSADTLRVMMKKEPIAMLPGATASICWAGYCYFPETIESLVPLVMAPAETDTGCFSHYGPNNQRGTSIVRWTFFDQGNPSDSVSFTAYYATYPAGTGENRLAGGGLTCGGFRCTDNRIFVGYRLSPGEEGRIELRNLAGNQISGPVAVTGIGQVEFDAAAIPGGICLASLVKGGRAPGTLKILVIR